jgi:hypothetical protein
MTRDEIEALIARLEKHEFVNVKENMAQAATALRQLLSEREWRPIESAPKDGSAFLAFGLHEFDNPPAAMRGVKRGDYWWAILLWDVWREPAGFVFAKDGTIPWGNPICWMRLDIPPSQLEERAPASDEASQLGENLPDTKGTPS